MQQFGSGATLIYFVFDARRLAGKDITAVGLGQRKAKLAKLLPHDGRVQYVADVEGSGADVLRQACKLGAEGIVSKLRDAPLTSDSTIWVGFAVHAWGVCNRHAASPRT